MAALSGIPSISAPTSSASLVVAVAGERQGRRDAFLAIAFQVVQASQVASGETQYGWPEIRAVRPQVGHAACRSVSGAQPLLAARPQGQADKRSYRSSIRSANST